MIGGRISSFVVLVVFTALALFFMKRFHRTKDLPIRRIAGLDEIDEAVGRATEMGKPTHFTLGYLLTGFDAQTFAGFEVLRYVAKKCAEYDAPIVVTNSHPVVYPVTEDIVRGAYQEAGRPDAYKAESVRYLSDSQLAYAAAVVGIIERERIAANIMIGQFYAESLIFAEAGVLVKAIQVAGTANTAQLPFFVATCDYTLIGEDIYAAGAYLSRDASQVGCLMAQELGKYVAVVLILAGSILKTIGISWLQTMLRK